MSVATAPHADDVQQPGQETLSKQLRARHALRQFGRLFVMVALLVVGVVYIITPFLAFGLPFVSQGWLYRPFVGTFVDHSLQVNDVEPTTMVPFTALEAGLTDQDRITAIDGQPLTTADQLYDYLSQLQVGDNVTLQVLSNEGIMRDVEVGLMQLPTGDVVSRFVMPYLTGLVYLAVGLLVYRTRRDRVSARAFLLMCASTALTVGLVFDAWTTQEFRRVWIASIPLAGAAAVELGMVFPYELRVVSRRPMVTMWPYLVALPVILWGQLFLDATPQSYVDVQTVGYFFAAFAAVILVLLMFYRSSQAASPIAREQARAVLIGSALAFMPFAVWVFTPSGTVPLEWVILAFVIFPLAIGYAILRTRLLDSELVFSHTITYTVMGLLVIAGHALLVAGTSLVLGAAIPANNPVLIAIMVFLTLLVFNPVRTRLQSSVDNLFFRTRQVYEAHLQDFGQKLTLAGELEEVVGALREQVQGTLHPTHVYVYLPSQEGEEYVAFGGENGRPESDIRFEADGALANALMASREVMYVETGRPAPPELLADQTSLAVLRAPVLAPLKSQNRLIGWLALGPKRSGEAYSISDFRFVEGLTQQAGLAVERAQVVNDLRRRVQELDVLSQVSQAVSFTLNFEDLLELVYAQVSKVVDTTNFYIILFDERRNMLRYAFFLEDNERLEAQEGEMWSADEGLAGEVVRIGHPIRTDNYVDECTRRNVVPHNPYFQAWMGAPLNVGVKTHGVIAVANFRRGHHFTDEQQRVFWAIADQAASALDKSRLFADAEARARQLATLNEISKTLSSKLEDLEELLALIMKSAVDILVAEAGSLLLTDQETGELVFRVLEGGATELVGRRLPRGAGIVGTVAETGEPVIIDDAANDPRWDPAVDKDTGFVTKTIVAVPLQLQDDVLGVLELLNKRDGTSFTDVDATLLATFASQAAVAIQNARLYQATDQELSERVDELSMLQRIDRELNTTLEVDRVIQITLDWALRVSGAVAGAVGMVDDEKTGLQILVSQGHDEEFEQRRQEILPLPPEGVLTRVVNNGKPELVEDITQDASYQPINRRTVAQMTVPILRVNDVIGVLILESHIANVLTIEDLSFINRLTEHASVAISNARLFQEVEAANLAKTEFVSFVSHELKTPMTSIRGYTDLLLSGQVGDVDDMQVQFLSTIRSNVDRMSRLVSDLADVSRMESGHLRLEMTSVPIALVVEETLRSMQGQIEEKSQHLTVDVQDDLPPVLADQTRMTQVLTNLVSNAYKYTPESGEITITVEQTVDSDEDGTSQDVIRVAVTDTGIGMSPEDLEQLFSKFFRSSSVKGSVPGTGLGLNITKNLIELHGGRIWVESVEGEGTTFTYTIPVAEETESASAD